MKSILISIQILFVLDGLCQTTFYDNETKLYGIIDNTGKIIMKPTYTFMYKIIGDVCVFSDGRNYGLLDDNGKKILNPIFSDLCSLEESRISEGLIKVKKTVYLDKDSSSWNYLYGFYDINSKLVIDYIFDEAGDFCVGKAIVGRYLDEDYNYEYNLINPKGDLLNPNWIKNIKELNAKSYCLKTHYDDLFFLKRNNDNVYVSDDNNIQIKTSLNQKSQYIHYDKKNDRALFFDDNGFDVYLINGNGEIVSKLSDNIKGINFSDNLNFEFINGLGEITVSETLLIDKEGKIIRKTNSSEILNFDYLDKQEIKVEGSTKYLLIDINGQIIKEMFEGTSNLSRDCNYGSH